jgi:hypothetical protein
MKLSQDQIDDMRQRLAESEFEGLSDGDLQQILLDGCTGYNSMADEEIVEIFENCFGEVEEFYEEEVAEEDA